MWLNVELNCCSCTIFYLVLCIISESLDGDMDIDDDDSYHPSGSETESNEDLEEDEEEDDMEILPPIAPGMILIEDQY